jgi:hypothetical protein
MYQGSPRDVHQAAAVVQPRFNPHRHRKRQSDIGWNRRGLMFSDGSSATGESSIVGVERETKSRCVPFACGEAETFDHNLYPRRPQVAPATQSFLRRRRIIVPIANGTWREITVKTSRRACRPIGLLLRSRRCRSRSMADWRALQWPGGSIEIDAGRKLQRVQAASPHRHWKIASPSSIAPPHKSPTTDARFTGWIRSARTTTLATGGVSKKGS